MCIHVCVCVRVFCIARSYKSLNHDGDGDADIHSRTFCDSTQNNNNNNNRYYYNYYYNNNNSGNIYRFPYLCAQVRDSGSYRTHF